MSDLILPSLEIRNFRAFRHLTIERLGRVNLIVGKNNVGKTSLLEALEVYAERGHPLTVREVLSRRDENNLSFRRGTPDSEVDALSYRHLFYNRKDPRKETEPIQIGTGDSPQNTLSLQVGWFTTKSGEERVKTLQPLSSEELAIADNPILGMSVHLGAKQIGIYRLRRQMREVIFGSISDEISHVFVSVNGLDATLVNELWESIALTKLEENVLKALSIITPEIQAVSLVTSQLSGLEGYVSIPITKLKGLEEPVILSSMGEGMNRMFGLALALVNAKDGLLLVDEIDTGLHYSVQPDMWRLVFETAQRLNVQVFATTHSWDCIEAFQEAAAIDNKEEALLIRLENKNGEMVTTLFDERRLSIATREHIEVR